MKRDYLSYSALKAFAKSPNHYLQYINREFVENAAMVMGSALHCMVLEPHEFPVRYIVAPITDRRTKAGKAEWAKFEEQAEDKTVLTLQQWNQITGMSNAVSAHRKATYILRGKQAEQPVNGKIDGFEFRGIMDAVDAGAVVDLKTTTDASPEGFKKSASNFDYHLQAAIYLRISGRERFYWIAVESAAPYNVAVYEPTPQSLEIADSYLRDLLQRFKEWDGEPVGYGENIYELDLPPWHPAVKAWNMAPKPDYDTQDTSFNSFINSIS